MLRDPVCGMQIQEAESYAVRHLGDAHVALCAAACAAQVTRQRNGHHPRRRVGGMGHCVW